MKLCRKRMLNTIVNWFIQLNELLKLHLSIIHLHMDMIDELITRVEKLEGKKSGKDIDDR